MDSGNGYEYNQTPSDFIMGGKRFKRDDLQAFVDRLHHPGTVLPKHLLMAKHLFHATKTTFVDFSGTLSCFGIESCPDSLDVLKSKNMSSEELFLIENAYNACRRTEQIHAGCYCDQKI